MENQEQSGRGRGRRRRRGGRRGENGRGRGRSRGRRGRGAIEPLNPRPIICINEVHPIPLPRQRTPLDLLQRNFNVDFNGYRIHTTVTSSPFAIGNWVDDICKKYPQHPLVFGLAVQLGSYEKIQNHVQPTELVDIIQLCFKKRCLIIQLSPALFIPEALERFFYDHVFVGLFTGAGPEVLLWYNSQPHQIDFMDENFVNLMDSEVGFGQDSSMEAFAYRELRLILGFDPLIRGSDWSGENLDESQVQYACVEAYVAHRIGMKWLVDP